VAAQASGRGILPGAISTAGKASCQRRRGFLRQNTICSQGRIIRLYLKELAADFHRLHADVRVLVAESPEQYAGLVPLLFRQRFTFWRTPAMLELRWALGGWKVGKINVAELVRVIEGLQREISRVAAASAA
jgi:hypothetical protein